MATKKKKKTGNWEKDWKKVKKGAKKTFKTIKGATTPVYSRYAAPTVGLFKSTIFAMWLNSLSVTIASLCCPPVASFTPFNTSFKKLPTP